jgi:hypothetical protein
MTRVLTEDQSGNLTFQERATDVDQDQITLEKVELDAIDGTTQSGGARDPSWLSWTSTFNAGDPSEMLIDVTIDASELSQGTTYTFLFEVSDGIETTTRTVDLVVTGIVPSKGTILLVSDADFVYKYDLSTGFDVTSASFNTSGDYRSNAGGVSTIKGMAVANNGGKLFLVDNSEVVYEYDLSTSFDPSTFTFVQSFDVSGQISSAMEVFFNTDGSTMFVLGNNNGVAEYSLGSSFSLSSVTHQQTNDPGFESPGGLAFNKNGDIMAITEFISATVDQYNLGTTYDVSTASFDSEDGVSDGDPEDVEFNDDGSKLFVVGSAGSRVEEYDLGTNYDISTLTNKSELDVSNETSAPTSIAWN